MLQLIGLILLGVVFGLIFLFIGQVGLLVLMLMKKMLNLKIRFKTDKTNP
jgi:hypothetical protein